MALAPINADHAEQLHDKWAPHCNAAQAEGWDIFFSQGSSYYVDQFQLQGIDCPDDGNEPRFAGDDGKAWRHVWKLADKGSALHVAAREFLREHSPEEFARIDDLCVRGIKPIYKLLDAA